MELIEVIDIKGKIPYIAVWKFRDTIFSGYE
jgi:hypothetical protein